MNRDRMGSLNYCSQFRSPNLGASTITTSMPPGNPMAGMTTTTTNQLSPPPVPPRRPSPLMQTPSSMGYGGTYGGYGGYGGSALGYGGSYNYRGYSGLGGYGSMGYGGYAPGMSAYPGNYGPSGDAENRFVQLAEESTRSTFQSVEAVVQTFTSITMMLESTFFAMTSSFRAILSVAENVGRLRSTFSQILGTFALIRFVKWLYRKVMYTFGLRSHNPDDDLLWSKTMSEISNGMGGAEKTAPSAWPVLLFLGVSFSIPYLLQKLLNRVKENSVNANDPKEWLKYPEPIYTAVAQFDFAAGTREELNLKAGTKVWLAPLPLQPKNQPGWWKATDGTTVGLIPSNYVTIVGQLKKKGENNGTVPPPPHPHRTLSSSPMGGGDMEEAKIEAELGPGVEEPQRGPDGKGMDEFEGMKDSAQPETGSWSSGGEFANAEGTSAKMGMENFPNGTDGD